MAGVAAVAVVAGTVAADAGTGGNDRRHDRSTEVVTLIGLNGERVGWVKMREYHGRVVVSGWAGGLTPGFHGFHVHAIGVCDPAAPLGAFTTAGGHYVGALPANHGAHAGDMPSLLVTASGDAWATFMTDRFTLDELRDTDGSAVMVHAGPDNFANIPTRYSAAGVAGPDATTLTTGDAGARVACGVID
jgi:Cu-Zn family superoxide dismutase